jgi:hypothetical protein
MPEGKTDKAAADLRIGKEIDPTVCKSHHTEMKMLRTSADGLFACD